MPSLGILGIIQEAQPQFTNKLAKQYVLLVETVCKLIIQTGTQYLAQVSIAVFKKPNHNPRTTLKLVRLISRTGLPCRMNFKVFSNWSNHFQEYTFAEQAFRRGFAGWFLSVHRYHFFYTPSIHQVLPDAVEDHSSPTSWCRGRLFTACFMAGIKLAFFLAQTKNYSRADSFHLALPQDLQGHTRCDEQRRNVGTITRATPGGDKEGGRQIILKCGTILQH